MKILKSLKFLYTFRKRRYKPVNKSFYIEDDKCGFVMGVVVPL
jgi:hypothetical protein